MDLFQLPLALSQTTLKNKMPETYVSQKRSNILINMQQRIR